ncbi:MAG TPA: zinc-binding dehydrogenase [Chthonomonadaceae bacterium]|nr:zinc-binding dehydrogenase [Chthonomonadaceae bacterium]
MAEGYRTVFPAPRQVILEPHTYESPKAGEVLIRTERTLISTGTELTGLSGDFPPNSRWARYMRYPFVVGYSNVGRVLEVGEGVDNARVGDRVMSMAPHATHALCLAKRLHPIPPGVDSEAASFATLGEIVLGGVRLSRVMLGESVVIVGAGLLGQLAARYCWIAGAWPVIVVDPAQGRLEFARAGGATHVLPMTAEEAVPEVERLTKGRMADVVFDITGNPVAMVGAVKLARKLGRVVLLGSPRGPVTIDLHEEVHTLGLEIIGAHNMVHPPAETPNTPWSIARHIELFFDWQDAGVLDVRPLITHRYPWRQTPEAFQMLLEDRTRALGVVLDWSVE